MSVDATSVTPTLAYVVTRGGNGLGLPTSFGDEFDVTDRLSEEADSIYRCRSRTLDPALYDVRCGMKGPWLTRPI